MKIILGNSTQKIKDGNITKQVDLVITTCNTTISKRVTDENGKIDVNIIQDLQDVVTELKFHNASINSKIKNPVNPPEIDDIANEAEKNNN